MIGVPPSPSINPPPSNPSSLLSASPRSPRMALPPMDRTSSASSAVSSASSSLVTLHLISQFTYPQGAPSGQDEDRSPPSVIRAKRSHTIAKIKSAVHVNWPGRPKVEGIRLIHSGRVLLDHETVGQVVAEGQTEAHLHLVVRPDAWLDLDMAPLTPTGPRSGRTTPVPPLSAPSATSARLRPRFDPLEGSSYFLLPSEAAAASSSSASLPSSPALTTMRPHDVLQMDSLPRVLSMSYALYYKRYEMLYRAFEGQSSTDGQAEFQRLYTSLGLLNAGARQALSAVEKQVFGWSPWHDDPCSEVATLELLLRECCQRVDELRLMLEQVELARHDPSADAGLAEADSHAQSGSFHPTPTTAPVPPVAPAAPHNEATASVQRAAARAPIPLPTPLELFTMFLPAAFLAIKLAILLYIFTRGASNRKKWAMYTVAYLWVAFEMVRAWRRRNRRLRSAARRAARQAAAASGNGVEPGGPRGDRSSRRRTSSRAGQATPSTHSTGTGVPFAPRRLTANSPTQPRFWLQRIAFLGMEEEDLELGFRPSSSQAHLWLVRVARERAAAANQRAVGAGALRRRLLARLDLSKSFNDLTFPIVLYLATLIPEVEELRTEEVRKRERLIRKWWKDKGANWVEEKRKEKVDLQEQQQQQQAGEDGEAPGESSGTAQSQSQGQRDSPQAPAELPRLLKHPYVLRLLALKPSHDGYVEPVDASATLATAGLGGRIDIQEELDAQRALERRGDADALDEGDNAAGGAVGAGAGGGAGGAGAGGEEGPDSEETEEEAAAGGAEDDFGFF